MTKELLEARLLEAKMALHVAVREMGPLALLSSNSLIRSYAKEPMDEEDFERAKTVLHEIFKEAK